MTKPWGDGMRVFWFTQRSMTDMCSTTIKALADGLVGHSHRVTIVGPGPLVSDTEWEHLIVPRSSLKGFQTSSLATNICSIISKDLALGNSVAIVDWPLAPKVGRLLDSMAIPWVLVDRSPPADQGILSRLQWKGWDKAWNLIQKRGGNGGCVVSSAHGSFVEKRIGIPAGNLSIIPAGVDLNQFSPSDSNVRGPLKLVYHGTVNKNRGLEQLPILHSKLTDVGVDFTLTIIGDGDYFSTLQARFKGVPNVDVSPKLSPDEISKILSESDVGLLTMPEAGVWNLASPLKRAEYLASGMVVCGINHAGHRIKDSSDWLQLFTQSEFIPKTVEWLAKIERAELTTYQEQARRYAEQHLSWSHSVEVFESAILTVFSNSR